MESRECQELLGRMASQVLQANGALQEKMVRKDHRDLQESLDHLGLLYDKITLFQI